MTRYKTIFSGRLEFGTNRSFDQVIKMYEHRKENYYKNEVALKVEEVFYSDDYMFDVPKMVTTVTDKEWRNTINLINHIAQFSIAGDFSAWMIEDGKVINQAHIEPQSDKTAVVAYLKGRELVSEDGKEEEAKKALSKAIEKFERHALAYERRGYVNFKLENFADAMYDYNKSIGINPKKAEPYFGRAFVKITLDDLEGAILDFELAAKNSIPLQNIYWKSRRLKAECLMKLEKHELAIKELKLFVNRKFASDNPNFAWRRKAYFDLGRAYYNCEDNKNAVDAFNKALEIEAAKLAKVNEAELLLCRGLALQKAGLEGYANDWEQAANKGSERAAKLLQMA